MVRLLETELGDPAPTGRSEGWRIDFGLAVACCLTLFTAVCTEGQEKAPRPTFTATDSAGVRVVVNSAQQWSEGEGWQVTPYPVLTLGTVDYPIEQQFQRLGEVTRLSDGTVVVLEIEDAELRAFDPSGALLWTAGGIGDGPGETRPYPDTRAVLTKLSGDTVQLQNGRDRIRYDAAGKLVEHAKLDYTRFRRWGQFYVQYCPFDNYFLQDYIVVCHSPQPVQRPDIWTSQHAIMRTDWDLERVDTLGLFFERYYWTESQVGLAVRSPLGPVGVFRVGGGPDPKLLYARNDAYRIEVWDIPAGSLSMVVEREVPRRARTDEEAAFLVETGDLRIIRTIRSNLVSGTDPGDPHWSAIDSVSVAEDLFLDEPGFMWVRRGPSPLDGEYARERAVTGPEGQRWVIPAPSGLHDVFRPDGVYLGSVKLPHDLHITEIGPDYVLGVVRDELDIQYVWMYGLDRGGGKQG